MLAMLSSKAGRLLLLGSGGTGAVTLALSTTSAGASETTASPSVRHVVEDKVSVRVLWM